MSKKQLKKRIKELEAENLILRIMASSPVYIYLYSRLPYRHYWQPYRWHPIGPVTCEPIWKIADNSNWYVGDTGAITETRIAGDTTNIGVDWAIGEMRERL